MSYYGFGGVSSDFVGLARERLRSETRIPHIYFTGCAGNIAAGKYNDGSPKMRPILSQRMYAGMNAATREQSVKEPVGEVKWSTHALHLPMSREFTREYFERNLHDPKANPAVRIKSAMGLAWWDSHERGEHMDMTALHMGRVHILHLPAECFIEYQLYAQEFGAYLGGGHPARPAAGTAAAQAGETPAPQSDAAHSLPNAFIAVAAYGDCGPAYIPVAEAYPQGGYEVTTAWVGPEAESVIKAGIRDVLLQGAV
jgi:hypothetical protein